MNPESFQFLFETIDRNPLLAVALMVAVVLVPTVFVVGTLWKVHPVVLWFTFATMLYGFSQCFPENRNQKAFLMNGSAVGSAIFTAWWCWRIGPALRKKFRKE